MRALVQRVTKASVSVRGQELGRIGRGLVVFLGLGTGDTEDEAHYLADKILNLRVFPDEAGRFNRSAQEIGGELLVVSQFTLYAATRKGRRPSFSEAMSPDDARSLFAQAVELFRGSGLRVVEGEFQEHMLVEIHNDGPVTIWIDSSERHQPRH